MALTRFARWFLHWNKRGNRFKPAEPGLIRLLTLSARGRSSQSKLLGQPSKASLIRVGYATTLWWLSPSQPCGQPSHGTDSGEQRALQCPVLSGAGELARLQPQIMQETIGIFHIFKAWR
jgi:hypothetical protein